MGTLPGKTVLLPEIIRVLIPVLISRQGRIIGDCIGNADIIVGCVAASGSAAASTITASTSAVATAGSLAVSASLTAAVSIALSIAASIILSVSVTLAIAVSIILPVTARAVLPTVISLTTVTLTGAVSDTV